MKLKNHLEMTKHILQQDNYEDSIKRGIMEGCVANDLCSMTTEYSWLLSINDFFIREAEKSFRPDDYSSFYQSHWGELSALHCMANSNGEDPSHTQVKVLSWFALLEKAVHHCDHALLEKELNEFTDELGDTVADLQFKLSDVLDTEDITTAKNRAIGMILHIIEDSYTISHCQRDVETGEILTFYCYDDQDKSLHNQYDKEIPPLRDQCFQSMEHALKNLLNAQPVVFKDIISVSNHAISSIPGDDIYSTIE